MAVTQLLAQNKTVTGKVLDEKGTPVANASVLIKGSTKGTTTSQDGSFSLSVPANAKALVISSVNFATQEVSIKGAYVGVTLQSSTSSLDEVVVVGYGTQKKKDVTGNVASVSGKALADKPVQSFEQALGGRAAGVQVTVPNGVLNNPPVIRIRGTNSISLSSYPLIVIDGVPAFTGDQTSTSAAGNALANINPADIESIDIAKDAAASAIYGSRAANGVVFVTTKKGKSGKAKVNYDGSVNWTTAQRLPVLLDAFQYTAIKNEGLVNAGTYNPSTNYFALTNDASGNPINTRWYDHVYRTGFSHNHNINVSGASEATSYYFSFGYTKQEGILRRNDFERKTVLANIDHKVSKAISVGGKLSFSNQINSAATSSGSLAGEAFATAGLGRAAFIIAPSVSPYNNNGTYNVNASGLIGVMGNRVSQVGFYNPVPTLDLNKQNSETNALQGNIYAQIKPLSWLTFKSVYGIDYSYVDNDQFAASNTGEGFTALGSATSNYNKNQRTVWTNTVQLDYTFAGKHSVSLLAGTEQQKSTGSGFGVNRTAISDQFFTNIQGGFGIVALAGTAGNIGENLLLSDFGRLTYTFDKKYTVNGTIRRDGASQLGSNNKYGTFYGLSAAWEITKENFWSAAKLDRVFSSFKLRGSYGRVGNIAGLSNFGTLSTYGAGLYATTPTLQFTNAGNPNLQWETSTKTDVGFNLGILKDAITAEVAYYRNNVDGLILNVTQPPSAGLPNSIATNVGTMYNEGIEFTLNANIISKKDFSWSTNFNISYNKNEVTSLAPGLPSLVTSTSGLESVNITLPGYSVGTLYVTKSAGIDATTGKRIFVNAAGRNVYFQHVAPSGQSRFSYTADGTTVAPSVSSADAAPYLNTNPKYSGGFSHNLTFKNFDLDAQFTYQLGFYMYYGSRAGLHDQRFWNNEADILGRWQKAGDINAAFPKVVNGDNISNGSSFPLDINVFKGDFVKLRSLTLGYSLPKSIVGKLKLSNARFYLAGNNLLILTKYPGPDPESSSNGNGATNQGVDRNQIANGRTIQVGIKVGF
jgi:TonB-dependent starch-binding outer membrane protein SusC